MRPELQDIVDAAAAIMGGSALLEDRSYGLVAFSEQTGTIDAVREASILQRAMPASAAEWFGQFAIESITAPTRIPADDARGIMSRICLPARVDGVTHGYLWIVDDSSDLAEPQVQRVSRLAEQAGAYLAQLSRERDQQELLVGDLLGTDIESRHRAVLRLADDGRIPRDVTAVNTLVIGCWDTELPPHRRLGAIPVPAHVVVAESQQSVTLIMASSDVAHARAQATALAESVVERFEAKLPRGAGLRVVAGVGSTVPSALLARESWLQARIAARVAARVEDGTPVAFWDDLGVLRILGLAPDDEVRAATVSGAVERLVAECDASTVKTLLVYLDKCGRVQETADCLSIHKQTVYYRLAKAERVTRLSLADGRHRTALHAALLVNEVTAAR